MKDSVLPAFFAVDDPFVLGLAHESAANKAALDSAERMGKAAVCVVQMPAIGEYVLLFPRGAFGEVINMQKSVLWALKSGLDKLKTAYIDMEEDPEAQKKIKALVKDLQQVILDLDKKGWEE